MNHQQFSITLANQIIFPNNKLKVTAKLETVFCKVLLNWTDLLWEPGPAQRNDMKLKRCAAFCRETFYYYREYFQRESTKFWKPLWLKKMLLKSLYLLPFIVIDEKVLPSDTFKKVNYLMLNVYIYTFMQRQDLWRV